MKKINVLLIIIFFSGCTFLSKTPKKEYKFTNKEYTLLEIKYRDMLSNKFSNRDIKKIQYKYVELLKILERILKINNTKNEELSSELEKKVTKLKIEIMYKIQVLEDLKD
ncbi:MAG: hypothetical protein ACRC6K_05620 [Fusobacteriaceae bacterium]